MMTMIRHTRATVVLPALAGMLALSVTAAAQPVEPRLVRMAVEPDVEVVHAGQTFNLVVRLSLEKHWHIYWINPGASGMPTDVQVRLPAGFRAAPVRFPRPKTFPSPEGMTYGYETSATIFVPITAPASLEDGTLEIPVEARWLVCKGVCRLGDATETVVLRTSAAAAPARPAADRFADARRRLPVPASPTNGVAVTFEEGTLVVTGPAGGHTSGELYPIAIPGVTFDASSVRVVDGRFRATASITIKPGNALGKPIFVRGVVALGMRLDDTSYSFAVAVDPDPASAARK